MCVRMVIPCPSIFTTMALCFFLLTTNLPQSHSQPPPPVSNYSICEAESYNCGNLTGISYPFWGQNRPRFCGGGDMFNLACHRNLTTTVLIETQKFTVLGIKPHNHTMTLKQTYLDLFACSPRTLIPYLFEYVSVDDRCSRFELKYVVNENCIDCLGTGGNCLWKGDDHFDEQVLSTCYYCRDGTIALHCSDSESTNNAPKGKWKWQIKLIIAGATVAGLSICITIVCFICKPSLWLGKFTMGSKSDLDIEAFLKNQGALTLQRCKFSYVKKITDSFKVKLGQGGFGTVYKGKLPTGGLVAVKILNSTKGNGQDFINEVASISRTSHVNIVNLLGFCLEGNKKALIYEFMHNGSLDKFIYKKELENIASLSWQNLYQIAIGIARGLEYLHKGCNTRILHFDIKPHNILLDENFCPKISDFGLAKLCPRKESVISMSDARGTIGYVAPELWNRHFGGVSHKSDVYSYGMMLLEMVGGRHNIHAEASNTSEIYFPHWVYNRLELGSDLELTGVIAEEENAIARRMTLVSLWCIQTIPNNRPPMSKVIDMLEGNMDSLEIPPKPILSSPTRSLPESSTTL